MNSIALISKWFPEAASAISLRIGNAIDRRFQGLERQPRNPDLLVPPAT
jgi:hypothetical protein